MLANHSLPKIQLAAWGRPHCFQQARATPYYNEETAAWSDRGMKGWLSVRSSKGAGMARLDFGFPSDIQEKVRGGKRDTAIPRQASATRHIAEHPKERINKAIDSFPKRARREGCGGYLGRRLSKGGEG